MRIELYIDLVYIHESRKLKRVEIKFFQINFD
jgi:hypothetical protein